MLAPAGRSKSRTPPSSSSTVRDQSSSTSSTGHAVRDRERQVEIGEGVAAAGRERPDHLSVDDTLVVLGEREHAFLGAIAIVCRIHG